MIKDENNIFSYFKPLVYRISQAKLFLITWHKCLDYFNFQALKNYLECLNISFIDNSKNHFCNNCYKAKVTKVYNCHKPQKWVKTFFEFIYTDLVRSIKIIGFEKEQYFFIFTDNFIKYMKIYTKVKKND